jgi:hypothetical protein
MSILCTLPEASRLCTATMGGRTGLSLSVQLDGATEHAYTVTTLACCCCACVQAASSLNRP